MAYGEALIDTDEDRIPTVRALSLDETLFKREAQRWSTQLVDARTGQLLDVVPGRDSAAPAAWLAEQDPEWLTRIRWAVMDLSGPYRVTFDTMIPDAVVVADPMLLLLSRGERGSFLAGQDFVDVSGDVAL